MDQKKSFVYPTSQFILNVELTGKHLLINLQDLVSWSIYSKLYTQDDIGKQIHKKAQLSDIYDSLSQQFETDQNKMKQKQNNEEEEVKQYKVGDVIKFKDIPCYKVDLNGKLTVYISLYDKRVNKQVCYQSQLNLLKIYELSEVQILLKKLEIEEKKSKQNLLLTKEQLKILLDSFNNNKQKVKKIQKYEKQELQSLQNIEKLKLQNQKLKKQFQNSYIGDLLLIDQATNNNQSFKRTQNVIQYISNDKNNNLFQGEKLKPTKIYFFNTPIPCYKIFQFKFRILRENGYINVGIVDYLKERKNAEIAYVKTSKAYHFANKIYILPIPNKNFRQGQVVTIQVNLQEGQIKLNVEGKYKQKRMIQDKNERSRLYVPFIQFSQLNDLIQIIY